MKNAVIIIFIFLTTINLSYGNSFVKGQTYQNNIKKVYNTRVTISLPPGKWEVVEIEQEDSYAYIDFENEEDSAYFYVTIPNTIISGDYFTSGGVKKCESKNEDGDKYKVHATGLVRSSIQVSYCIQDIRYSDGDSWLNIKLHAQKPKGSPLMDAYYSVYYPKRFSNIENLNQNQLDDIGKSLIKLFQNNINGRSGDFSKATQLLNFSSSTNATSNIQTTIETKKKLMEVNLEHKEKICSILDCNRDGDDGNKFQDYIESFLDEGSFFSNPYLAVGKSNMLYGSPGWGMGKSQKKALEICDKYSDTGCEVIIENGFVVSNKFYKELLKISNTKSTDNSINIDSESNKEVCLRATTNNGMGWESMSSKYGDYVNVAFKRNLSLIQCRKLTGRLPKTEKITETKLEKSSIKDRLIELKSMLDDGLISQELYDTKSAKLLEDF
tara:strand:- start:53 stop:1372 length:1320 start_codon:yes stop_codon:yes gene_type:complete